MTANWNIVIGPQETFVSGRTFLLSTPMIPRECFLCDNNKSQGELYECMGCGRYVCAEHKSVRLYIQRNHSGGYDDIDICHDCDLWIPKESEDGGGEGDI